jgi:hypothetical protein
MTAPTRAIAIKRPRVRLKDRKRKAETQAPLAGGIGVGQSGPIIERVCVQRVERV